MSEGMGRAKRARDRLDRLDRLQRIAGALSRLLTPAEVADVILGEVAPELGGATHVLWLVNDAEDALELVRSDRPSNASMFAVIPMDSDLPGAVVTRTGTPLWVASRAQRDQEFPPLAAVPSDASFAVLPLNTVTGVAGVLAVAFDGDHTFEPDERAFLNAVADLAGQAIVRGRLEAERVRVEQALRDRDAQQSALVERLEAAQRSQAFLLRASTVLARASGYVDTLHQLAEVAVPTLGDLCLIDVVQDGRVRRMVARHADPARRQLVEELEQHYPPDPDGAHPSIDVIRTGRSRWSATMTESFLRATCRDERHLELVRQLDFTSYMTIPLLVDDRVLGTVTLVSAGSGRRFGPDDVALAEDLAKQVAEVVDKARRYDDEHRAAHTLQSSLLPATLPALQGISIAVRYLPGTEWAEVGGDWFDGVVLPSGAVALAVGDVTGHDVGAAAAMGQVRSAARALAGHATGPASLIELMRAAWDRLGLDRMATFVIVELEPASGAVTIASAGHPPPLMVTASGGAYLPVVPSTPLGAPAAPSREWRGTLEPGAVLLLYTDGLVEERGLRLEAGLARLAAAVGGEPVQPEAVCDRALDVLPLERSDDVALLAVARVPTGHC